MKGATDFLFGGDKSISDKLCDFIIRPPRAQYSISDLGSKKFRMRFEDNSPYFVRRDLTLYNMRGMCIVSSWYLPGYFGETAEEKSIPPVNPATGEPAPSALPCVVYCHANCGSRYDGQEALFLLEEGFSVFTFDFCGSGQSEGKYISLGISEREDLAAVVEYLSMEKEVSGIALWGRSMGAVTSIMYGSKDPSLRCMICDSPFASLDLLIRDIVATRISRYFPEVITRAVIERLRRNIERRAEVDIAQLETTKYAEHCRVPCFLIHGNLDDFVDVKHTMRIRNFFPEDVPCLHEVIHGGHNSLRDEAHPLIIAFLRTYLVEKPQANAASAHGRADAPSTVTASKPQTRMGIAVEVPPSLPPSVSVSVPSTLTATHMGSHASVPPHASTSSAVLYGEEGEEDVDASLPTLYEAETGKAPSPYSTGLASSSPSAVRQGRVVTPSYAVGVGGEEVPAKGHPSNKQHHPHQRQRQFSEDPPSLLEESSNPAQTVSKAFSSLAAQDKHLETHEDPTNHAFDFTEQQKPIEFSKPHIFE